MPRLDPKFRAAMQDSATIAKIAESLRAKRHEEIKQALAEVTLEDLSDALDAHPHNACECGHKPSAHAYSGHCECCQCRCLWPNAAALRRLVNTPVATSPDTEGP